MQIFKPYTFYAMVTSALALIALQGCGKGTPEQAINGDSQQPAQSADKVIDAMPQIECALDNARQFSTDCENLVIQSPEGDQLIISGADGSFRRFDILTDGRGLQASDGAEQPVIRLMDDKRIEVSIGKDRYLLPAKLKPSLAASPKQKAPIQ